MRIAWILTVGLLAAASASAQTAQDALKQVPDDALGCVLVNRLDALSGKLDAAARRMKIPAPMTMLDGIRMVLGGDKGMNAKGTAAALILPGGPTGVTGILLVPVSDYDAFATGLGAKKEGAFAVAQLMFGKVALARRGMFAAVVKEEDQATLTKFLASTPDGAVSKSLQSQPWTTDCDLAGIALKPAIRLGASFGEKGLKMAAQQKNPDPTVEEIFAVYRQIGQKILDASVSDVPFVALVGKLDILGNIDVSVQAPFVKDSPTAKAFAPATSSTEVLFAGLPNLPFAMAAGGEMPAGTSEAFAKMTQLMTAAVTKNLTPAQRKELEENNKESMRGIKGISFVMGVGKGDEPLFHSMFLAYRVEDSAKLLQQMEKSAALTKTMLKNLKLPGVGGNIEFESMKVAGKPAMSMVTDMTGLPDDENNPAMQKMRELYFGPAGKMTATLVAIDKQTVFGRYSSPAETEQYVKNQMKPGAAGLDKNKEVMKTTSLFPKGTQFTFLLDMAGMMKFTNRVTTAMNPPGNPAIVFPEPPVAPPFGFAGKITSQGAALHFILPTGSQNAIGVLVDGFKGMMQQAIPGKAA